MTARQEPDRLDEVTGRQLTESFAEAPFPQERIRARVRRTLATPATPRQPFALLTRVFATAGLVVTVQLAFVAGMEYGRRLPSSPRAESRIAAADLPLAIQSAGTQYIAAVAQFADQRDSLSSLERTQAREVALAVLSGVVVELLRSETANGEFARILQAAMARERAAADAILWF